MSRGPVIVASSSSEPNNDRLNSMHEKQGPSLYHRSLAWLSRQVASPNPRPRRKRMIVAGAVIFLAAFGVRLIHWQDYQLRIGADQASLVSRYKQQAQRMLDGDGILYPTGYKQHSSIQLLVHPPGYSIFIAMLFGLFGQSDDHLVRAQIICDSLAAVLVFLISAQVMALAASVIAGLLVAFSPHLAHHSLMLLPESLAVLPILIAVLLLIRAGKQSRLVPILTAGAMIGVSCWLRSNTLLLAPFLALAILLLLERSRRMKYAMAFVFATIVVISPITIRNWVVFGHFIPLSLGSGVTMIEGIADYDKENRFGMPVTDGEAKRKDVEWHNRPDYAVGLWRPDGIERDRYRFARGLDVIRKDPVWFAGVMIRRAAAMLRYNDSLSLGWPADTAIAPIVSAEPSFGHQLVIGGEPVWSSSAPELLAKGRVLSPRTECALAEDRETLTVAGNDSGFDDQFSSAPIAVQKNTDYVLKIPLKLMQGRMAAKVTSADRRIALASLILLPPEAEPRSKTKVEAKDVDGDNDSESAMDERPSPAIADNQRLLMPFATGSRSEVLLVLSNNGPSSARPTCALGAAELLELGQTPHRWSRFVRPAVRLIERSVYRTSRMLPLIGIGIILLAAARRWRVLLVLLVVPAYYLSVQSALHTEYRYILAIHYFLSVMAAVTLSCFGAAIAGAAVGLTARSFIVRNAP
ncbi:MAG: glycosyltransferase family 39 protein [Acidobacteriota bacterium]